MGLSKNLYSRYERSVIGRESEIVTPGGKEDQYLK